MAGSKSGRLIKLTVISFEVEDVVAVYETPNVPDTTPSQARTFFEDGSSAVRCRCEMWPGGANPGEQPDELMAELSELVRQHWGERDPATMLPYLKSAGVPARFAAAARHASSQSVAFTVLHTDLDHFKAVNEQLTEPGGNVVLREFADRLRLHFGRMGVVVRTGGEEFSALLFGESVEAVVLATLTFRQRMAVEPFARLDRANTCSIGLSIFTDASRFTQVTKQDHILELPRQAERRAKNEGRDRIALSAAPKAPGALAVITVNDLQLAALAGRRQSSEEFSDVTSLSLAVREGLRRALVEGRAIAEAITSIRDELSLSIGDFGPEDDRPHELLGRLSVLEWASIVVGALFQATRTEHSLLDPAAPLTLSVDADGAVAVEVGGTAIPLGCAVAAGEPMRAEAGRAFFEPGSAPVGGVTRRSANAAEGCDAQSPVLLLPIGDVAKEVAEEARGLVAAIVDVDDRPARGGGLPDFWQSNVSRVVRSCLDNPNIGCVIAIGDTANARLTLERLEQLGSGSAAEIQRSLALRGEHLQAYAARGIDLTTVVAEREAVVSAIGTAVAAIPCHDFEARPVIDPFLRAQRRLPITPPNQGHRLEVIDGLRTLSLADAYPEALQLIRGAKNAAEHDEPQRGTFREMTGFKVVLTEPFSDRVPEYWQPETAQLNSYYDRTFADGAGLFGKRLLNPHGSGPGTMTDVAIDQTIDAILRSTPTRRINLPIVPDTLDQPLGLGCIQLMPRLREGAAVLDPIFVWRTVDALVGFPFSAYGSIRWTEDFIDKVNAKLPAEAVDKRLRIGTLTYVALSFHMYLHDGDMHIARTIVQDASL